MSYDNETVALHSELLGKIKCNENCDTLGNEIANLEGGVKGLALNSFQGAVITTLLCITTHSDEILVSNGNEINLLNMLETLDNTLGINVRIFDSELQANDVEKLISNNTKLILMPTLNLPRLELSDIEGFVEITKKHKIPLVVDNTLASPFTYRPIEHGANIVIENTNPYLAADADLSTGIIVDGGNFDWNNFDGLDKSHLINTNSDSIFIDTAKVLAYNSLGYKLEESLAKSISLRIETLYVRMKQASKNALDIMTKLTYHPKVVNVYYPLAPTQKHIDRSLKNLNNGGGCFIIFEVTGVESNKQKVLDNLDFIKQTENEGTVKTEISSIIKSPRLITLFIGLEALEDINNILENALDQIKE